MTKCWIVASDGRFKGKREEKEEALITGVRTDLGRIDSSKRGSCGDVQLGAILEAGCYVCQVSNTRIGSGQGADYNLNHATNIFNFLRGC
jgi:hypothetical protein